MKPIAFVFVLFLSVLNGCEKDLPDENFGNPDSTRKVLIAGTGSAFKLDVIRQVAANLGTNDVSFRVTGLNALSDISMDDYKAILLISPIQAGKINSQVENFIRAQASNNRIILFYTRGSEAESPNWVKPDFGVDTVTSASIKERTDKRAEQIAELIRKRIGR